MERIVQKTGVCVQQRQQLAPLNVVLERVTKTDKECWSAVPWEKVEQIQRPVQQRLHLETSPMNVVLGHVARTPLLLLLLNVVLKDLQEQKEQLALLGMGLLAVLVLVQPVHVHKT